MEKKRLIGLTLEELRDVAASAGLRPFAAKQMASWLYVKRVASIDAMTDLPLKARAALKAEWEVGLEAPLAQSQSKDGTVKYVFRGVGRRPVESVYIPDKERATLCVSSQAGCRMGCKFCMTGQGGYDGDLTTGQIINQILSIPESSRLTNIVFMGMGEPLDNLLPVLRAIEILTAAWGMAWSPKRITVSTIGKLKELRRLLDETKVHIALSVHNPFPSEREAIMPVERAFPLRKVMELLRGYDFTHQRRLSLEYIMWEGVNTSARYADALARLVKGVECRVNLIRYHAAPGAALRPATREEMEAFRDRLNAAGVTSTIRASRGEDIEAACGMLAGNLGRVQSAECRVQSEPDGEISDEL